MLKKPGPNKSFKPFRVYGLFYPNSKRCFYIGITTSKLRTRLTEHLAETKSGRGGQLKHRAISRLLAKGLRPFIVELDRCSALEWEFKEREWIARFRASGYRLTNRASGGLGQRGVRPSQETKDKIAEGVRRYRASVV